MNALHLGSRRLLVLNNSVILSYIILEFQIILYLKKSNILWAKKIPSCKVRLDITECVSIKWNLILIVCFKYFY